MIANKTSRQRALFLLTFNDSCHPKSDSTQPPLNWIPPPPVDSGFAHCRVQKTLDGNQRGTDFRVSIFPYETLTLDCRRRLFIYRFHFGFFCRCDAAGRDRHGYKSGKVFCRKRKREGLPENSLKGSSMSSFMTSPARASHTEASPSSSEQTALMSKMLTGKNIFRRSSLRQKQRDPDGSTTCFKIPKQRPLSRNQPTQHASEQTICLSPAESIESSIKRTWQIPWQAQPDLD